MGSTFCRVAQAVVSCAAIIGGIALSACTFGLAAPVSSALVGAGVSGLIASFKGSGDWLDFSKQVAVGAMFGLISWGAGSLATNICGQLCANVTNVYANFAINAVSHAVAGAATSASGTILMNLAHGNKWNENLWRASLAGCVTGTLAVVAAGTAQWMHKAMEFRFSRAIETVVGAVEHMVGNAAASVIVTGGVDPEMLATAAFLGGLGGLLRSGTKVDQSKTSSTTEEEGWFVNKRVTYGSTTDTESELCGQNIIKRPTEHTRSTTTSYGPRFGPKPVKDFCHRLTGSMSTLPNTSLTPTVVSAPRVPYRLVTENCHVLRPPVCNREADLLEPKDAEERPSPVPSPPPPPPPGPRSNRPRGNPRTGGGGDDNDDNGGPDHGNPHAAGFNTPENTDAGPSDGNSDVATPEATDLDPAGGHPDAAGSGPPETIGASPTGFSPDAAGAAPEGATAGPASSPQGPAANAPASSFEPWQPGGAASAAGAEGDASSLHTEENQQWPVSEAGGASAGGPEIAWSNLADELAERRQYEVLRPEAPGPGPAAPSAGSPNYVTVPASSSSGPMGGAPLGPAPSAPSSFRPPARSTQRQGGPQRPNDEEGVAPEMRWRRRGDGPDPGDEGPHVGTGGRAGPSSSGASSSGASSSGAQQGDAQSGRRSAGNPPGMQQAVPTAQVHQLVHYSMEKEAYELCWDECIEMPDRMRVLGVIGPMSSGKTTFVHSLVFNLGYALPKKEGAVSWVHSSGVWMYVLKESELVVLDCTSSTTDATLQDGEGSTARAALTDPCTLFTMLASCQVLVHCPHADKAETTAEERQQMLQAAASDLAQNVLLAGQLGRLVAPALTVVLRGGPRDEAQGLSLVDSIDLPSARECFKASGARGAAGGKVCQAISAAFPERHVLPLLYRPASRSCQDAGLGAHTEQLAALSKHLLKSTGVHWASASEREKLKEAQKGSRKGAIAVDVKANLDLAPHWFELMKEVQSDVVRQARAQQANADNLFALDMEQPGLKLREWIDSVNAFLQKERENDALRRSIEGAKRDVERMTEEQKRLAKEDKDPWHSFRVGLILASALARGGLEGNSHQALRIGLQGLCLMTHSETIFKDAWVKLAVQDYNVLAISAQATTQPECWWFLRMVAESKFKLELLQWGFLAHVRPLLQDPVLSSACKAAVLDALYCMLEPHKASSLAEEAAGGKEHDELALMAYFSAGHPAKQHVQDIRAGRAGDAAEVQARKQRGIQQVQQALAGQGLPPTAEADGLPREEKHKLVIGFGSRCCHEASVGVALWCVEPAHLKLLLPKQQRDDESIRSAKFLVLHRLAFIEDSRVLKGLLDSEEDVAELVAEYFSEDRSHEVEVAHWAGRFASNLIAAEAAENQRTRSFLEKGGSGGGKGGAAQAMTIKDMNERDEAQRSQMELGRCRLALLRRRAVPRVAELLKLSRADGSPVRHQATFSRLLRQLMVLREPEDPDYKFTKASCEELAPQLPSLFGLLFDALRRLVESTAPRAALSRLANQGQEGAEEASAAGAFQRTQRALEQLEELGHLVARVLAFKIDDTKRHTQALNPIDPWKFYPAALARLLEAEGRPLLSEEPWQLLLAALNYGAGGQAGRNLRKQLLLKSRGPEDASQLEQQLAGLRQAVALLIWNVQCCADTLVGAARQAMGAAHTSLADLAEPCPAHAVADFAQRLGPKAGALAASPEAARLHHLLQQVPNVPASWAVSWDVKTGWEESLQEVARQSLAEVQERKDREEQLERLELEYGKEMPEDKRSRLLQAAEARRSAEPPPVPEPPAAGRAAASTEPAPGSSGILAGALAVPGGQRPGGPPPPAGGTRWQRVKEAAQQVKRDRLRSESGAALEVLQRCLRNAATRVQEDPKFGRIRKASNVMVKHGLAQDPAALGLLELCGFADDGEMLVYSSNQQSDKMCLVAAECLR